MADETSLDYIRVKIRDVPDFPKKGILFKDIAPYLADPSVAEVGDGELAKYGRQRRATGVIAPEARGFIFGRVVAKDLHVPFYMARKDNGKTPYIDPNELMKAEYELEYGTDSLVLPRWLLGQNRDGENTGRILLVDDVLATGGTMEAIAGGITECGLEVAGVAVLIELENLGARKRLEDRGYDVFSVLKM